MAPGFQRFALSEGVNLYVQPTQKFKTVGTYVHLHLPLSKDTVTATALLPMVMARGSAAYPTTAQLARRLDELYGAAIGYDVGRRGEIHALQFTLTHPAEAYLDGANGLLDECLETLSDVLLRPAHNGAGLHADHTAQEKRNLRQMIEALINDKRRYAAQRCRELLCPGEPYSLYHLGRVQDLDALDPVALREHHAWVMSEAAIDIFMVGDIQPQQAAELCFRHFRLPTGGRRQRPVTAVQRQAGPRQEIFEELPVNQGVLMMGMRTGITSHDPDYLPMVVANGILGSFPHSKLFMNVREKHSLAYYAYSGVESLKGVGFIYAGIDFENYEQARDIALEQLGELQAGKVTEQEYQATIKALVSDALSVQDSPGRMVEQFLSGLLSDRPMTPEERAKAYRAVSLDAAVAAARKFQVETIYFLTKEGHHAGRS